MECDHDYRTLKLESLGGARGTTNVVRGLCSVCEKPIPGPDALARLVMGMRDEIEFLRKAVNGLGAEILPLSLCPSEDVGDECQHFLSWLEVEESKAAMPGYRPSSTVRCKGCGKAWPDHARLINVMKAAIEVLREEVRKL